MPAAHPSANRFRNRLLQHAARDGMLITLRCNGCRRQIHFWAADLIVVLGPDHQVHEPPWPCSKCKTRDYIDVKLQVPGAGVLASGLTIRRPVRKIEKWIWKDEKV